MVRLSNGTVKRILREIVYLKEGNILDRQQLTILNERMTLMHERVSQKLANHAKLIKQISQQLAEEATKRSEKSTTIGKSGWEGEGRRPSSLRTSRRRAHTL
ncbi:hypothetical protein V6N11_034288 [Hibiscus sabdariffa]|uniref:Uncharacterized protein n=2 Tax=Hibiscus sabdariffa TaxID=183260 RepID=A0ABR2N8A9_9ROSI